MNGNIIKDYTAILKHYNGIKPLVIEEINEILLKSIHYKKVKQYGVKEFLDYYKPYIKTVLLARKLENNLTKKGNICKTIKI